MFLDDHQGHQNEMEDAAALAREIVNRVVSETGVFVHVVSGRAKQVDSLRGKLRRKQYKTPSKQVTDLIGVRVITYYRDQVDIVIEALKKNFEIDSKRSVDKRQDLGLRDFGYSSVHLIARSGPISKLNPRFRALKGRWFEIQVRSVLEHAWAEIEHEVVYKSGIKQPDEVRRRFAALAGTLELLDKEFLALREERQLLINAYADDYSKHKHWRKAFDVASLRGFLKDFHRRRHWPMDDDADAVAGAESSCVEALMSAGLSTPSSLTALFKTSRYRTAINSFAALKGIATYEVSPLARVVVAVLVKDMKLVRDHFPEIMFDSALNEIADTLRRRRR